MGPDVERVWEDLLVDIPGGGRERWLLLEWQGEQVRVPPAEFMLPVGQVLKMASAADPSVKRVSGPEATDPARTVGTMLFEALFEGARARFLARALDQVRGREAGLCIRVRAEDDKLHELPWELLFGGVADRPDFLALDPAVCVVRTPPPGSQQVRPVTAPLRVLLALSGSAVGRADADRLAALLLDGPAQVDIVDDADGSQLLNASQRYHAVHVYPAAPASMTRKPPAAGFLSEITAGAVTCLLDYYEAAEDAKRLARHVPAVVGWGGRSSDSACTAFTEAFYRSVIAGRSIQTALSAGRREADYALPGTRQWASAICYLTGGGPLLADPQPARVTATELAADADYDELRAMIAQRNLEVLRQQAARLGPAVPPALADQLADLERGNTGGRP